MKHERDIGLTDVFVEWKANGPRAMHPGYLPTDDTTGCFDLYKVEWLGSLISLKDKRVICHFRAPDAEAVRMALHGNGTSFDALWTGTLHGPEDPGGSQFIVEHRFSKPGPQNTEEILHAVARECLALHQFKLNRAIISRDRTRVICLCAALSKLVPCHDQVWPFRHIGTRTSQSRHFPV